MSTGLERFLALSREFCAALGRPAPELAPNADGAWAFHAILRGHAMTVVFAPCLSEQDATLLFDAGELPAAEALQACKTLLATNHLVHGTRSPVLGLDARDHMVLQMPHALDTSSGEDLLDLLRRLADWADALRANVLRPPAGPVPGAHLSHVFASRAWSF